MFTTSVKPHHEADSTAIKRDEDNKVITFKPKGLNIVWGNDPRYWRLPKEGEDAAELIQVSWLEVTGSAHLQPGKKYEISFNVSLKPDAFGWSVCQVQMMAKVGKRGKYIRRKIGTLDKIGQTTTDIPEKFEIEVPPGNENQVFFGLYEVWSGKWKGGLQIHYATIKLLN